jgi:site-specific DNA recombinase
MRAAGYIRVSTSGQIGPDKVSLENQQNQIQRYCDYKQWEVLTIYNESAASGAKVERPVLQRLLDDATHGTFGAVVYNWLMKNRIDASPIVARTV